MSPRPVLSMAAAMAVVLLFSAGPLVAQTTVWVDDDNCPTIGNGTQEDSDGDGPGNACDCDSANDQVWATPGEVNGQTTLTWTAPLVFGSTQMRYDSMRSTDPSDFLSQGLCLETDSTVATSSDVENPLPGRSFDYLVRSENDCPLGGGNPGTGSYGYPRSLPECP